MAQTKLVLCILAVLYSIDGYAQIRPPKQTDTLVITSVKYNYADILKENWPCKFIYKSTTSFKIADKEFKIIGVENDYSHLTFTVADITESTENTYELFYREEEHSSYFDQHKTVTISFSGYEFICSPISDLYMYGQPESHDTENYSDIEDEVLSYDFVEEKPSFKGGDANAFSKWVNENLVYPEIAKENGVSGRVTLQFTVNTDGTVSNVRVLHGVSPSLDKEAVRVVSLSPRWKPGKIDGQPVKVTYTFPVIFQLR